MRDGGRFLRAALGSILLVLPLACGSDGDGPMDPGNGDGTGLNVTGTWEVTATLIEEDCPVEVEEVTTGTIQIQQNGTQITLQEGLIQINGTIDLQSGDFSASGRIESLEGDIVIMEDGRFSSSTMFTSETTFTFEPVDEPSCTIRTQDVGTRQ